MYCFGVIKGALVSVHYRKVVAKSNRIQILLSENGKHPNKSIRGSKFSEGYNEENKWVQKHIFTYFLSISSIQKSVALLEKCAVVIQNFYNGNISNEDTENINSGIYNDSIMKKNPFLKTLVDCFYVEKFSIDMAPKTANEQAIVTLYKTGIDTMELLSDLN